MTDEVGLPLIEGMSDAELQFNLAGVGDYSITALAEGPWPEPHCGVCRALLDIANLGNAAAQAIVDFHDTPFRRGGTTKHYREGKEVFRRCLRIYRAAGWTGEARVLSS